MSKTVQAVIWDLDGVIVDSADAHRISWQQLAKEEGITYTDAEFWSNFGKRNDDIIATTWGTLPPEQVKALGDRKEIHFRHFIKEGITALPGVTDLLCGLHEASIPQALASSTPIENITLISDILHLRRYLSVFISGDMVAHGKPAPDIFLKAADALGIDPRFCLVIEDAVAGVQAAHAAGMLCIAVAGDRDILGLHEAELMVRTLQDVSVERIQNLGFRHKN